MNKMVVGVFLAVPLLVIQSCASTEDKPNAQLAETLLQCNSCHSATQKTAYSAPSLDGMEEQYFIEQLQNFRFDKRGADSLSALTQEMSRQAKALSDEQLAVIAAYYEQRAVVNSPETVAGDIYNGEALYTKHCAGCHSSSFGRFFTKSPKIGHLKGPYILDQLTLFAANKRDFHVANKHKSKMVAVSKRFTKQQLSEITAYIKSAQFAQ